MKFYHGTSEERWKLIQREGFLWGYRIHNGESTLSYRYTYLSPHLEVAIKYGDGVVLEVEYDPHGVGVKDENGEVFDNYGFEPLPGMTCWQFSVFKPISLSFVKRLFRKEVDDV